MIIIAYLLNEKKTEFKFIEALLSGVQKSEEIKIFTDCADHLRAGKTESGIYEIEPIENEKFKVYCNMELGGWTVIMKRDKLKDKTKFNRPLSNYKSGFGDLNYNHWLGNL